MLVQHQVSKRYHGENKLHLMNYDDVRFVLDQHAKLNLYNVQLIETTVYKYTCHSTLTYYPDSKSVFALAS